jgi:23S rRNA pseudouridine955/2504/2580 synthase
MTVETREVIPDEADIRLDRWFRRHFPGITQGALQKLCRTGQIRVDGKRANADARLQPGQMVRIPPLPEAPALPPAPKPVDERAARELQRTVIYQDKSILVLNKPTGLPVQGGPGITKHVDGMLDALRFGAPDRPRLVHRIDRDTSGLLLLARTPGAAAKLAASFRTRKVEKSYWAVVVGRPDPASGKIDRPLARIGGPRGERSAMAAADDPKATMAITEFRTIDTVGKKFAWMDLAPHTGRTHQLRVHMASIGHPILGDAKYGVEHSQAEGYANILHLHARFLSLPHPEGGTITLEADLPPHMEETFRALGFHAPITAKPRRA